MLFFLAVGITAVLFIIRVFWHTRLQDSKAFNLTVLQIQVPKERKNEGQGNQGNETQRVDQLREEIGITETLFSTVAGLRAQRGLMNWLRGRTDNFSFEIVARNNLVYFYVAVPKKLQGFIEQQIHAQYPYAQIEAMTDYNIFTEKSAIIGAYLGAKQKSVFPFKTYKKSESDPLSALLNVLGKNYEGNTSLAIQYIVRSANRKWRRPGVRIVREVRKGEKFESVAHGTAFGRFWRRVFKELGTAAKTKDQMNPKEHYQLSPMEEDMLKGIEEKLAKGGMDVTVRLLSVSDNQDFAKMNLDNLTSAFAQYNLYRYGNEFYAAVPRNQTQIIRHFIYRAFNEKRRIVMNTEELASLWHLPLPSTEASNIKWLQGRKSPPPTNLPTSGLKLGFVDFRGVKQDVFMKEADRRRHLYIIGKSGTGKSVTIANLAIQDIKNGKGVAIVDPHGDLVEAVLEHIPKERADDVVIFDPSDMERPMGQHVRSQK